jgi:hypothetical protein
LINMNSMLLYLAYADMQITYVIMRKTMVLIYSMRGCIKASQPIREYIHYGVSSQKNFLISY